jgi:hypothetical protein
MKIICLEDFYLENKNLFRILGAGYTEKYLTLTKGKIYECYNSDYGGLHLSCNDGSSWPIDRFIGCKIQSLKGYRNDIINKIIN